MFKKGIALVASLVTFVFFFLEMLAVKSVGSTSLFGGGKSVTTTPVTFTKVLFGEDYANLREHLGTTTVVLWVVFVLAILSVLVLLASLLLKKNSNVLAKTGAVVLVVALLALFVVNIDKATLSIFGLAESETYVTNLTVLYFVALVFSLVGVVSTFTLDK